MLSELMLYVWIWHEKALGLGNRGLNVLIDRKRE